jgi:hypothetical protein
MYLELSTVSHVIHSIPCYSQYLTPCEMISQRSEFLRIIDSRCSVLFCCLPWYRPGSQILESLQSSGEETQSSTHRLALQALGADSPSMRPCVRMQARKRESRNTFSCSRSEAVRSKGCVRPQPPQHATGYINRDTT